ncbi:small G protein family protein / RhoGAP family protein [Striga asiatica]|uniref:Small G protein family protein / RhoGAP family protein n=1 Tax=Striga asiatica TaxID=4170 RepID=A0A5A7Q860_STRAF|nr:small G protein family protein / RhoGAP family protein [Striga asiatica]
MNTRSSGHKPLTYNPEITRKDKENRRLARLAKESQENRERDYPAPLNYPRTAAVLIQTGCTTNGDRNVAVPFQVARFAITGPPRQPSSDPNPVNPSAPAPLLSALKPTSPSPVHGHSSVDHIKPAPVCFRVAADEPTLPVTRTSFRTASGTTVSRTRASPEYSGLSGLVRAHHRLEELEREQQRVPTD